MSKCANLSYPIFANAHDQSLEELLVQTERFEKLVHEIAPHLGYICVLHESNSYKVLEYQLSIRKKVGEDYINVSVRKIMDLETVP